MMQIFYGIVRLPTWGYIALTFALVQLMLLGVTLYLHRDQSHGGLQLHPAMRHFFRFWLWFSSSTVTKEWVAVHRRHHVFADRDGDPHSPVVFGLNKVLTQGYELYAAAATDPATLASFGRGTPDDWLERNLYSRFPRLGIVLFVLIQLVLFGVPAITMLGIQLIAQPLLAAGIINGLGHHLGYRSFEVPTFATNIVPWGLLIAGEELHNNHHAFPSSPRFSVQRWELDVGWIWICALRVMGLARVSNLAPIPNIVAGRGVLDATAVGALFTNRLHVLRDYRRRVIKPVVREFVRNRRDSLPPRQGLLLLSRNSKLLDAGSRQELRALLERHPVLRIVVDFRDRLQLLWDQAPASQERALENWLALADQARGSNIPVLRDFATRLANYAPAPRQFAKATPSNVINAVRHAEDRSHVQNVDASQAHERKHSSPWRS